MPIRYELTESIRTSPERAFALIDDLSATQRWLPPCVSLEKIGSGPNAVGDQLHYVFQQGGRQQEMSGEILARVPNERLYCKYVDSQFEVEVDLRVAPGPDGTLSTHIIQITPKSWLGKLFSPLIRLGLKKQTHEAAANLKKLLETESA
ncbi:MAG: SRPBCC family protein [Planctomycetes bacterium]|nr:SRPBCC family protein [Planctomycetota bacterium]